VQQHVGNGCAQRLCMRVTQKRKPLANNLATRVRDGTKGRKEEQTKQPHERKNQPNSRCTPPPARAKLTKLLRHRLLPSPTLILSPAARTVQEQGQTK